MARAACDPGIRRSIKGPFSPGCPSLLSSRPEREARAERCSDLQTSMFLTGAPESHECVREKRTHPPSSGVVWSGLLTDAVNGDDSCCEYCCCLRSALRYFCSIHCRRRSADPSLGRSRRNRAMNCTRSAGAQCSAGTGNPVCSTIARVGACCRTNSPLARSISASPAADAPSETQRNLAG